MKGSILIVLLSVAIAERNRILEEPAKCSKQSDCKNNECCTDTLFFPHPVCLERPTVGQACLTSNNRGIGGEDIYYFACPCRNMQICVAIPDKDNKDKIPSVGKCVIPPA